MKKLVSFAAFILFLPILLKAQPPTFTELKDIVPGIWGSLPSSFQEYNGKLYFFVYGSGAVDNELWVTDGSTAGTQKVKDLLPVQMNGNVTPITVYNGKMYFFTAEYHGNVYHLWQSDGTEPGTVEILTMQGVFVSELTVFNNKLYFIMNELNSSLLWSTDGTVSGTARVEKSQGIDVTDVSHLIVHGGKLYFDTQGELWQTNGSVAGTAKVASVASQYGYTPYNGKLYFSAGDGTAGEELWVSDGTTVGTVMLKDIEPGAIGAQPWGFTEMNGKLFFGASTQATGLELWMTDGTTNGTTLVKDIAPGSGSGLSGNLAVYNGKLYFQGNTNSSTGNGLWSTDGTASGTQLLYADLEGLMLFKVYAGKLFFDAFSTDPANTALRTQLWYTDGTTAGTEMIAPVFPPPSTSFMHSGSELVEYRNELYFKAAYNTATNTELWKLHLPMTSVANANEYPTKVFYPNPTTGTVNIKLTIVKDASVAIYSLTGQLMLQQKISAKITTIDVKHLAPGMYTAHITTAGQTTTEKLVRQ